MTNDEAGYIIPYQTADGITKVEVTFCDDTVWLSPSQMAELFQREKSTISRHVKGIYDCGELNADLTVAYFATVRNEGYRKVSRDIACFNLDVIISELQIL